MKNATTTIPSFITNFSVCLYILIDNIFAFVCPIPVIIILLLFVVAFLLLSFPLFKFRHRRLDDFFQHMASSVLLQNTSKDEIRHIVIGII